MFSLGFCIDTMPSLDPTLLIPPIGKVIVTSNGVQKLLNALNANKAGGPDKLPTRILKELSQEMAPLLAELFQQSLDEGKLTNDWKIANIVPVFKRVKDPHLIIIDPSPLRRSHVKSWSMLFVIIFGNI